VITVLFILAAESSLGGRMKVLLSIAFLLSAAQSYAANCSCIYKMGSPKIATEVNDHWWGSSVRFYCDYTCTAYGETTTVRANHDTWWVGDEEGNEFVCEGTIYKERYSANSNWFYYNYERSESFHPGTSKSDDLKNWAYQQDCE
jgi:hypothetical protein